MPAAKAAYKRTIERLATAKLAWDCKQGYSDVTAAAKQQAIKFAKDALQASAAPPIKGPGDDAFWNTIFGDPTDRCFWRSDASFWLGAELPQSSKTPRLLAEAHKQEELNEALAVWRKSGQKREN
jgi:hypothetical protein